MPNVHDPTDMLLLHVRQIFQASQRRAELLEDRDRSVMRDDQWLVEVRQRDDCCESVRDMSDRFVKVMSG